ncbi:MAG: hypothetical protein R3C28_06505 [Pirellulaceae bacterium]
MIMDARHGSRSHTSSSRTRTAYFPIPDVSELQTSMEPIAEQADSTVTSTVDDSSRSQGPAGGSKREHRPSPTIVREPSRDTFSTDTANESDESAVRPATTTSRGFFPQIKFSKLPVWGWAVVAAFAVWVFYPSNRGPEIAKPSGKPAIETAQDALANVTSEPIQRKVETNATPVTPSPQMAATKQQGPSPLMDKLEKVEQAVLEKQSEPEAESATAQQPETSEPTQVAESAAAPSLPADTSVEFGLQPPSNGQPLENWFHDTFPSDASGTNQDTQFRQTSAPRDIQAYRPEDGASAVAKPRNRSPESYVHFDGSDFGAEPDYQAAMDQFAQDRSATQRAHTTDFDPYATPDEYATGQRRASSDLEARQPTNFGPTYPETDVRNYDFPEDAIYRVVRQLGARR